MPPPSAAAAEEPWDSILHIWNTAIKPNMATMALSIFRDPKDPPITNVVIYQNKVAVF